MAVGRRAALLLAGVVLSAACARGRVVVPDSPDANRPVQGADTPPAFLLGTFRDDYGGRYTITRERLVHGRSVYDIVEWHVAEQFVIAKNAQSNPAQGGLWTRIDWLPFTDQGPFTWGYCFTVFDAPTREVARLASAADRRSPRSGCNGFPFSRMQRVPDGGA